MRFNISLRCMPTSPVATVLAIAVLIVLAAALKPHVEPDHIESAFFNKLQMLAVVPGPRIIIIGGSNAFFGLDSQILKTALGQNVVNDALHVGFGCCFLLNSAKQYLHSGDVVLICPEYEQFFGTYCGNETLVNFLLAYPQLLPKVSFTQLFPLMLSFRTLVHRKCIEAYLMPIFLPPSKVLSSTPNATKAIVYKRSSCNQNGDMGVVLNESAIPSGGFWLPLYINRSNLYDPAVIAELNEFARRVSEKGVRVFFMHPYISNSFYRACAPTLEELELRLRRDLRIPIIGILNNCVLPDKCFWDTRYHLLTRYKKLRTIWLLPELQSALTRETQRKDAR